MRRYIVILVVLFLAVGTLFECLGFIQPQYDVGLSLCSSGLAALATMGASVLGDIIGGLFGSSATNSTNETNLRIARETNEQNYKIFQEQLGYNTKMYEDAKSYNSPVEQRERLKQAGLNPYAMLGAMQPGNVSAATSPSANAMVGATMIPNLAMAESMRSVGHDVASYFDLEAKRLGNEQIGLDNDLRRSELKYKETNLILDLREKQASIDEKLSSKNLNEQQRKNLKTQRDAIQKEIESSSIRLKYLDRQESAKTLQGEEDAKRAGNEALKAKWEADLAEQSAKAFPKLNQAQLSVFASQAAANRAASSASSEQAKYSKQLTQNEAAKKIGIIIENGVKVNQWKASQFDLNEKEIQDLIRGNYRQVIKEHPMLANIIAQYQAAGQVIGSPIKNILSGFGK